MHILDYREALGLGFDDDMKVHYFTTKTLNLLKHIKSSNYIEVKYSEYFRLCQSLGIEFNARDSGYAYYEPIDYYGDIIELLSRKDYSISEFLYVYIAFINTLEDNKNLIFLESLKEMLTESKIQFEVFEDEDGFFVFPKGAKELDDALVSEPLDWLKDYPKSRSTFSRALKQYSDGEHTRDIADNFRKALEEFFQEFLGNTKNLANNKTEICKFLGSHNAEPEVASMMQALLNSYDKLNNSAAKHNDKLDSKYLEFLMYQTGLFIRMIITVGKE